MVIFRFFLRKSNSFVGKAENYGTFKKDTERLSGEKERNSIKLHAPFPVESHILNALFIKENMKHFLKCETMNRTSYIIIRLH